MKKEQDFLFSLSPGNMCVRSGLPNTNHSVSTKCFGPVDRCIDQPRVLPCLFDGVKTKWGSHTVRSELNPHDVGQHHTPLFSSNWLQEVNARQNRPFHHSNIHHGLTARWNADKLPVSETCWERSKKILFCGSNFFFLIWTMAHVLLGLCDAF